MKYAICLQPYIPMRSSASEAGEMVSQLIFGDTFRITEEMPRWYKVTRDCDEYEGWIDWKTATEISEAEYKEYLQQTPKSLLLRQPYNPVTRTADGVAGSAHLSWGSRIYNMDDTGITFRMQGQRFDVPNMTYVNPVDATSMSRRACSKYLLQQAQMLLNVPYLWGGCSAFGIDCSGFTQTLYRFINIALPRDASQQIKLGEKVSYEEREAGDLAFFGHGDEKVSHVGLVAEGNRILHCSASLHYDELRPEGIWSESRQELTHNLIMIKRYF